MTKSAEAFRTISEVSDLLGTPTHVLRFWEGKFPQVKPVKRAGGRRYYRPADVMLLGGIKRLLHEDGLTIRGVQKLLKERGTEHVMALATIQIQPVPEPVAVPEPAAPAPPPPWRQGSLFETPDETLIEDEAPMALDVPEAEPLQRVVHLLYDGRTPVAPPPARAPEPAAAPRDIRMLLSRLRSIPPGRLDPLERLRLLSLQDRLRNLRGRMAAPRG